MATAKTAPIAVRTMVCIFSGVARVVAGENDFCAVNSFFKELFKNKIA
jgi:hypothetical protein